MYIHHICIQTSTYAKSLDFYQEVLGFKILQETADFHGRAYNTWLDLNGFMIELQTAKAGEPFKTFNKQSEGIPHFCLYSDQFDKTYESIKGTGKAIFRQKNGQDIYKVEGGRLLKLAAPEGTIIEIRDQMAL